MFIFFVCRKQNTICGIWIHDLNRHISLRWILLTEYTILWTFMIQAYFSQKILLTKII